MQNNQTMNTTMPWSYTPSIGRYPMRVFKSMQSGHNQTATVSVLPQSKGNAQIISRRTSVDLFTRFGRIFILLIRIPFMFLHNIRSSFALYKPHSHYTNGLHKMHSFFTLYKAFSYYAKCFSNRGDSHTIPTQKDIPVRHSESLKT